MKAARLSKEIERAPASAVALIAGAVRLHTGILYRTSGGSLQVLHLAMHYKLRTSKPNGWSYAVPNLDEVDLITLAGFCTILDSTRPRLPYGLRFASSRFDDEGRFIAGQGESGLMCSTLVVALFEWAGIPLLVASSWEARPDDLDAQRQLLEVLRACGDAAPDHIIAIEGELGCVRIRPEEVAAATTTDPRPMSFPDAARIGAEVLAEFDQLPP